MGEKVTWMVLKVDLKCPCCYKKVKKILCKFPQIRDQTYDEQKNLVRITVVCCSPEKIRDKLFCKGKKVIQSIEIIEIKPPKPAEKPPEKPPKPAEKPPEKPPKPAEKPPEKPPKPAEKPPENPPKPAEKPPENPPKPVANPPKKTDPAPAIPLPPPPALVPVVPAQPYPVPVGFCFHQCYDGYGFGPCYHGCGRPPPPPPPPPPSSAPPCCDSYYGYGKVCYVNRCDYFSEENTSGCTIM